MSKTKDNIIQAAIDLFGQHGIAEVRLQMIADQAGISVGNMAYHFKNKEAIIKATFDKLVQELQDVLSLFRTTNTLSDFDLQLDGFYCFNEKNPFFFLELIYLQQNYPQISANEMQWHRKILFQIHNRLLFDAKNGLLIKEPIKDYYKYLAHSIWMQITFFTPQKKLLERKNHSLFHFKRNIWSLIIPFLTQQGGTQYKLLIEPIIGLPIN